MTSWSWMKQSFYKENKCLMSNFIKRFRSILAIISEKKIEKLVVESMRAFSQAQGLKIFFRFRDKSPSGQ